MRATLPLAIVCGVVAGCHLTGETCHKPNPPTYSQYHLDGYRWDSVSRVIVLPVLNESPYTNAGDEVRSALTSELQRLGRFEVIAAPADDRAIFAKSIHRLGRFDEGDMIAIGRTTRADVVVHATVTQYSPYPRPRIGLIVQAVGPQEAKVVASVDGLWDTTDHVIADRIRMYYRQRPHERPAWLRNNVIVNDDSFADELALDSPALFHRFVCYEASRTLLGLPVPGVAVYGPPTGTADEVVPVSNPHKPAGARGH